MMLPPPLCKTTPEQGGKVMSFWRTKKAHLLFSWRCEARDDFFQVLPCFPPSFILSLLFISPDSLMSFVYSVFHVKFSKGAVMGKRGYVSVVGKLLLFPWFFFLSFYPFCFCTLVSSLNINGSVRVYLFLHLLSSYLLSIVTCSSMPWWYIKWMGEWMGFIGVVLHEYGVSRSYYLQ